MEIRSFDGDIEKASQCHTIDVFKDVSNKRIVICIHIQVFWCKDLSAIQTKDWLVNNLSFLSESHVEVSFFLHNLNLCDKPNSQSIFRMENM